MNGLTIPASLCIIMKYYVYAFKLCFDPINKIPFITCNK